MADLLDAAAAVAVSTNDSNVDDVEDLYADLDEQVAAALAAAGESGDSNARDSDPVTDGEGEVPEPDANEAVDLGDGTEGYSSSDEESDDGLRIVLNEDTSAPLPRPPVGRGEGCVAEDEEGDDTDDRVKGSSVNDGGWATVGGLQCKGLIEKTPLPIMGQIDRGHQHVFQRDYNFSLPRNGTIFDIDIEAFQQKPWRQQGVDLTDYFNFSLDEEGWRKYWCSMKKLRLGARSLVNETSGLEQESYKLKSVKAMSKVANGSGSEGRNGLGKPKGRAIHVEGSACERVPSADLWRPIQRDSDVVIQVNMTLSPSNHSTLDDSSKLNHKGVATERVVDKEVHDGGSSEGVGSKLDRRDSYFARDQSRSPDYSDMLSGESKENLYFKRSDRHSDFRDFFEDTKLKDEHVKFDFNCYSSRSDREDSESCSRGYTPSADDRKVSSKLLWRGEAPFAGQDKSSKLFVGCNSDRDVKSRHETRKGQRRHNLDDRRNAIFVEKEKPTDSYPSRYDRKYEKRRSSSSSLRTNYHNSVRNQSYEQRYSPLERIALKNDEHYFSNESNYHRRQSLSCDISEGEDVDECFSSANEWQRDRDHIYHSMVKTDMPDADDGQMYRERYSQEKRRAIHDRSMDVEFSHYTDYRICEWQSPVRGRYRDKGRFAKSNDWHFRHANHLELYPGLNNSERDRPATGFSSMSSRSRCINNKKVRNAKMAQNDCHGYHQKNKQHDSSFCIGNSRSALRTDTFAETGRFVLPIKRKLHSDLGSVDQKTLADLPLLKGRRLMHGQSIVSDRRIYALKLHKSTEKINTEAICSSLDMRNSNTVSNICVGRRHELDNADNIHLNDRKIKFERQGNELRRVIENNQKGHHPVDRDLHASGHKHVHQKPWKQNMGHHHSGNQDLDKSADQKWLNEDVEVEEGELIEEDHHDIISKSKLKPRNVVLKSVIETGSAEQLQVNNTMSKDAACNNRATRECDDKHILEVMEKMQKRRERFKEAIAPQKEDGDKKDLSSLACSTDYIQNQRPARKRRWGGNSWMLEMP
ncbi:hypothetical protein BDA96_01G419600 [Sorghum bicolor]|uniref:Pre-mRNA polyadenylation factor Fip1 domain-containing protein n=1 Tax=Sorghum bicolor TaxID=4558 RepID=A0A921V0E7_SORBI|nr:hypothetical protein BDA96_01G419600 [Sorghum bicolor]